MKSKITKEGNVFIPKKMAKYLEWKVGDYVNIRPLTNKILVIKKEKW